jgi:hypothetical protein
MTAITRLVLTVIVVSLTAVSLFAQSKCLSPDQAKSMLAQVNSPASVTFNKKLHDELRMLVQKTEDLLYNGVESDLSNEAFNKRVSEARSRNNDRLCHILKEFGWPSSALVGKDGVAATVYLIRNSRQLDLQVALLPVVIAAVKQGEGEKRQVADLVDRMRVDSGMKQLFGTQVKVANGFLVLAPI